MSRPLMPQSPLFQTKSRRPTEEETNLTSPNTDLQMKDTMASSDISQLLRQKQALPRIPFENSLLRGASAADPDREYHRTLIGNIQDGCDLATVKPHLEAFDDDDEGREMLNWEIDGYPAIFYVVETHNPAMIELFIKHGGNPNATCGSPAFPLIAFAIIHGALSVTKEKATRTLITLLRLGASPDVFPKAFYQGCTHDLPPKGPKLENLPDLMDENKKWCLTEVRKVLARSLTLSQRYRLEQASRQPPIPGMMRHLAQIRKSEGLLDMQYSIVGQEYSVKVLRDKLSHRLLRKRDKPLVLVFAGPSGHGKTELATNFGRLLSMPIETVDCTMFSDVITLFGVTGGYSFSGLGIDNAGTRLNNFLAANDGQPSVVFLDEFEKTKTEVQEAFLQPFDKGTYQDRRYNTIVDSKRTMWILATNAFDRQILDFCDAHRDVLSRATGAGAGSGGALDPSLEKPFARLRKQLRATFESRFGAPLAGRVDDFVPFLTFNPMEQAAIFHSGVMDFEDDVHGPHVLVPPPEGTGDRLMGNVTVNVRQEASLCATLAERCYSESLGARSIARGVEEEICEKVEMKYLKSGDRFVEGQEERKFEVGLDVENEEVEVRQLA